MKKIFYFLFLLVIFSLPCDAQTGWQWAVGNKNYGADITEGWPIAVDKFGNVFGAAVVNNGDSSTYGSFTIYNPNQPDQVIVTKVDSDGNNQWVLGAQSKYMQIGKMATDANGDLYVLATYAWDSCIIGSTALTNPNHDEIYALIKISATGTVLWAQNVGKLVVYDGAGVPPMGAPPCIGAIDIDAENNIFISGIFYSDSITIGSTTLYKTSTNLGYNIFVAKYNNSGSPIWARSIKGESLLYTNMVVSEYGTIYLAGAFSDTLNVGDLQLVTQPDTTTLFIVKLDSSGHAIWANLNNQHHFSMLTYSAIATDHCDKLYVTGYFEADLKYGPENFTSLLHHFNVLVACIDSSSNIIWANAAYSNSAPKPYNISIDHCGKLCISGSMESPSGILLANSDTLLMPAGSKDPFFVLVYDTSGAYIGSTALPSGGDDESGSCVDNRGNLYVCGDYYMTTLIAGKDTLVPPNVENFFIAKYKYDEAPCPEEMSIGILSKSNDAADILIYPNPTEENWIIKSEKDLEPGTIIRLYDLLGKMIGTYPLYGNISTLSATQLMPGIYFCHIVGPDGQIISTKKLVHQ